MTRRVLLTTPRFDVCVETVHADVRSQDFYYLVKPNAVLIVPYSDDRIVLLRTERLLLDSPSLELPGGRVEANEAPLSAAKRELAEECLLSSDNWQHLITSFPLPSVTTEQVHVFAAQVSISADSYPRIGECSEGITCIEPHCFSEARKLALSGAMRCAVDAFAVLLFLETLHQ